MNEVFPIVSGLVAGGLLGLLGRRVRLLAGAVLSVVLGVAATVISGEYKIGWEFLLIDIPLVGVCAFAGLSTVRAWRVHASRPSGATGATPTS